MLDLLCYELMNSPEYSDSAAPSYCLDFDPIQTPGDTTQYPIKQLLGKTTHDHLRMDGSPIFCENFRKKPPQYNEQNKKSGVSLDSERNLDIHKSTKIHVKIKRLQPVLNKNKIKSTSKKIQTPTLPLKVSVANNNRCRYTVEFENDVREWYKANEAKLNSEVKGEFKHLCSSLITNAVQITEKQLAVDKPKIYNAYKQFVERNEEKPTRYPENIDPRVAASMMTTTQLYYNLRISKFVYTVSPELHLYRSQTLTWMLKQCYAYRCFYPVYFLAVDYFDRYITSQELSIDFPFYLFGITCVLVATKVVGGYTGYLNLNTCAKICKNKYDTWTTKELKKKVSEIEMGLMMTFDFLVAPITCMEWFDYLSRGCIQGTVVVDNAVSLLVVCSLNFDIMSFRSDIIARAVLLHVLSSSVDQKVEECLTMMRTLHGNLSVVPQVYIQSYAESNISKSFNPDIIAQAALKHSLSVLCDSEAVECCLTKIKTLKFCPQLKTKSTEISDINDNKIIQEIPKDTERESIWQIKKNSLFLDTYAFKYPINDSQHLMISEHEFKFIK